MDLLGAGKFEAILFAIWIVSLKLMSGKENIVICYEIIDQITVVQLQVRMTPSFKTYVFF